MKWLYSILVFGFISCSNSLVKIEPSNKNQFTFKLIDGLGTVSLSIPERTDTFLSWIQRSDCGKPCEKSDYRFQSKRNPIFMESGFYWTGEPKDSVDQLSIYHQRPDTLLKFKDSLLLLRKLSLRDQILDDPETGDLLSDTLIKINDRHFYVFQIAGFDTQNSIRTRRLIAFTTVSGTFLEFHYKLSTKIYDSVLTRFLEKSMTNLATVRIKDGG